MSKVQVFPTGNATEMPLFPTSMRQGTRYASPSTGPTGITASSWEPPFGEEQGRLTQDTITVKEDESETYPKGMPSPLRDPNSEGRDSPNHIRVRVPHGGAGEYEYE